jgi:hypothetical protein
LARAVNSGNVSNRAVAMMVTREPVAEPETVATPVEEALSPLRSFILQQARAAVGATEFGEDKRFEGLFGKSGETEDLRKTTLESARINAGKKGAVHTTCIDFQTVIWARAKAALEKSKGGKVPKIVTPSNAPTLAGWVEATPGMPKSQRPKPGDIYVLSKIKRTQSADIYEDDILEKGKFSHTGFVEKIIDNGASETWVTLDGGQGAKTVYDANGNLVGKHGAEKIARVDRSAC